MIHFYNSVSKRKDRSVYQNMWLISLLCILISCADYSIDELLAAPEQIEIDGREYVVESNLWRNFFPVGPPSGLYGIICIVVLDSLEFPSTISAKHAWVINGDDVWDTDLINPEIPYGEEYKMKIWTKDIGPDWGPHIYVDVAVEIVHDENGSYLMRADSQWIGRLD